MPNANQTFYLWGLSLIIRILGFQSKQIKSRMLWFHHSASGDGRF